MARNADPFVSRAAFESLPAEVREYYDPISTQQSRELTGSEDYGYQLSIADVAGYRLDRPDALRGALSRERQNRERLEAQLRIFDGLDPSQARAALRRVEEMKGWLPDERHAAIMDEKLTAQRLTYEERLRVAEQERASAYSLLESHVLDGSVTQTIVEAGGNPRLLFPLVRSITRGKRAADGRTLIPYLVGPDGQEMLSRRMGEHGTMSLKEYVSEILKRDAEFRVAFKPDGAPGTGGRPSEGSNGYAGSGVVGDAYNITEADARDPVKYRRARTEAERLGKRLTIVDA